MAYLCLIDFFQTAKSHSGSLVDGSDQGTAALPTELTAALIQSFCNLENRPHWSRNSINIKYSFGFHAIFNDNSDSLRFGALFIRNN